MPFDLEVAPVAYAGGVVDIDVIPHVVVAADVMVVDVAVYTHVFAVVVEFVVVAVVVCFSC